MWAHEISVLIEYAQVPLSINAHADVSREARGINVCLNLYLYRYFVYASSDDSCGSAYLRICADSQEPSLLADPISAEFSCTDHF